jgi:hypothetical protein
MLAALCLRRSCCIPHQIETVVPSSRPPLNLHLVRVALDGDAECAAQAQVGDLERGLGRVVDLGGFWCRQVGEG